MMFNMQRIGLKISELRKAKNMTQMELADQMDISFQAVSNWERGNSMPDISKLPELARIFGVTIDALIGEDAELLNSVANGTLNDYLEEKGVTVSELSEAAPLLKPEQVDTIFKTVQMENLSEIMPLLPFIGRGLIHQLAQKAAWQEDISDLIKIAPFADQGVLDEIAEKLTADRKCITGIAPFLSKPAVSKLAEASWQENGIPALKKIAPFVPREQLQKIAQQEYEMQGLCHLGTIAPYLGKEYLTELAKQAIQKEGFGAVRPIAPFVNWDLLSKHMNWNNE